MHARTLDDFQNRMVTRRASNKTTNTLMVTPSIQDSKDHQNQSQDKGREQETDRQTRRCYEDTMNNAGALS